MKLESIFKPTISDLEPELKLTLSDLASTFYAQAWTPINLSLSLQRSRLEPTISDHETTV